MRIGPGEIVRPGEVGVATGRRQFQVMYFTEAGRKDAGRCGVVTEPIAPRKAGVIVVRFYPDKQVTLA